MIILKYDDVIKNQFTSLLFCFILKDLVVPHWCKVPQLLLNRFRVYGRGGCPFTSQGYLMSKKPRLAKVKQTKKPLTNDGISAIYNSAITFQWNFLLKSSISFCNTFHCLSCLETNYLRLRNLKTKKSFESKIFSSYHSS